MNASLNRVRIWAAMAAIVFAYLVLVGRTERLDAFGIFHDDSAYFSSAKALAEGKGYVIPSLPGAPTQTMYPIAYAWMLSWVWKIDPAFPSNLTLAIWLTKLFGCWVLISSFLLLRQMRSIGDSLALLLTGICAVNPFFIFVSGAVFSDVPFMAVLLTGLLLADRVIVLRRGVALAVVAGVLAGLAASLRTIGVAFAAGVLLNALYRRRYREAGSFAVTAAITFLAINTPVLVHPVRLPTEAASLRSFEFGWQRTLADYTSYAAVWRFSVPNAWAVAQLIATNAISVVVAPGRFLLAPLEESVWAAVVYLMPVITIAMLGGIVRDGRSQGWKTVHFMLPIYAAIVLIWPYPQEDRFLLAFLPFFIGGLAIELRNMTGVLAQAMRGSKAGEKSVAIGLAGIVVFLSSFAGWRLFEDDAIGIRHLNQQRSAFIDEERQAYEWIRGHTDSRARFEAYKDMTLYLYTGRQAVRPTFSEASAYMGTADVLEQDLAHIGDAAHHVGAEFWLAAPDDFALGDNRDQVQARIRQVVSVLPLLFRSSEGHIRIYDAHCVADPLSAPCSNVAHILFPYLP